MFAYMFTDEEGNICVSDEDTMALEWNYEEDEMTEEERAMEDADYAEMYDLEEDEWIDPT